MSKKFKELNMQIGKRLKSSRENLGITQEAFAEVLEVDVAHYRKLENGQYGLSPEKMLVLYKCYKIDPTYLITGEKNRSYDVDLFLANCGREERDRFLEKILAYMGRLMIHSK